MDSPTFEVLRVFVLSTAHVPHSVVNRLEHSKNVVAHTYEEGFWVLCPTFSDDVKEETYKEFPELVHIFEKAEALGCHWIRLDADALVYPCFGVYEW